MTQGSHLVPFSSYLMLKNIVTLEQVITTPPPVMINCCEYLRAVFFTERDPWRIRWWCM